MDADSDNLPYLISADSHLVEPIDLWEKTLGERWGDAVPHVVDRDGKTRFFTGREYYEIRPNTHSGTSDDADVRALQKRSGSDPDARLTCLAMDGIAAEVLTGTWMLYVMRTTNSELRRQCASVFNDWAADIVSGHTDKLCAIAIIPTDDVSWAVDELERCAARGMGGAAIFADTAPDQPPYRDASYDRFWAAACASKLPIMLHIITGNARDTFTYLDDEVAEMPRANINLFGEVQPVLAGEFIYGGVLDRFAELNIVLGEYEVSWLPYFSWRLQQYEDSFAPHLGGPLAKERASHYLSKRIYHGVISDPHLKLVADVLGDDVPIMWGSDFPHTGGTFPRSHEIVHQMLAGLSPHQQRRIAGQTAAELFGLTV